MSTSKMSNELPPQSAGGGRPSEAAAKITIKPDGATEQHLDRVFRHISKHEPFQDGFTVTDKTSFLSYMQSPSTAALAPPGIRDLNFPMSSYYISSSHNTYLSGHQLYGEASTEAYVNVLKRGCRCLEIDVWDGEEIDTSASESDAEQSDDGTGRPRSNSKSSRWARMKKKAGSRAVQIRRSSGSSPSRHHLMPAAASHPSEASGNKVVDPNLLSPTASLTLQEKSEPRVLHGYTLTQSVPFRAVVNAIKASAFIASDLPIIVSLEVHANLDQQHTMVEIMKEVWADHLINITEAAEEDVDSLPSPGSLKNKILIKVKWTPNSHTGESNNPTEQVASSGSSTGHQSSTSQQQKASKVIKSLSELGVYTRAYTFKRFDQPEASIPTHVFSLSEGKVHDMHTDPSHGPAMFSHNMKYLMRVFPKGTRIGSTNVDPAFHWRQGAQMVALNWQKLDKGMMLNEGMFSGYEGWVLKPEGYRGSNPSSTASTVTQALSATKKYLLDLKIQLLAGQDLPLPPGKEESHRHRMKPYVKIQLHVDTHGPPGQGRGVDSDAYGKDDNEDDRNKRKSKTQRSDAPNFEGEVLSWTAIPDVVEELSFIRYVLFCFACIVKVGKFCPTLVERTMLCCAVWIMIGCIANVKSDFRAGCCVPASRLRRLGRWIIYGQSIALLGSRTCIGEQWPSIDVRKYNAIRLSGTARGMTGDCASMQVPIAALHIMQGPDNKPEPRSGTRSLQDRHPHGPRSKNATLFVLRLRGRDLHFVRVLAGPTACDQSHLQQTHAPDPRNLY